MSAIQDRRQQQRREARLEIVAKLYKRGWSIRAIAKEAYATLNLPRIPSTQVIWRDIQLLLKQWREARIENMDAVLQLELERIDTTCRELWQQWEKSKDDYVRTTSTRSGRPRAGGASPEGIEITHLGDTRTNQVGLGNPQYIAEIRQQLAERRKLLGLYAPEKKDISAEMSFSQLLIESGVIEPTKKNA